MPCCAFAVFLVGQIALALDRVRTRIFGEHEAEGLRPNLSVAWQPGMATVAAAPSSNAFRLRIERALSPRMLMLAVTLEITVALVGVAGVAAATTGTSPADLTQALSVICHGGHLTAL